MRITGTDAAAEYVRRHGRNNEVDAALADHLADGLVEFDTATEKFFLTERGHLHLWDGGGTPN